MAFQDWFGRTTKHYTSTYKGSTRLAWDSGLTGSYSSFFAPDLNKTKLLKDSFRHACDIKSIMNIPHTVNIQLNVEAETSCTDGNTVVLSTKAYDDSKLDNNTKLDIFLGTTIHEFSHVLHTDFRTLRKYTSETFVNQLFNIIEDERIENLTIQQYPGYANFLGQAKYYYFDLMYDSSATEPVYQVLANILYIVRYPAKVDETIISTYKELFSEIKPILSSLGQNSAEAHTKAEEIYKILLKYLQFPPSNPENGKGESNKGSGQANESKEGNSSEKSEKSGKSRGYSKQEIEEAAKKMAEKMKKVVTANSSLNSTAIRNAMQSMEITDDLKHINPEIVAIKKKNNQSVYAEDFNKVKSSVNGLVNAFSKFFVEQDYRLTGMRRGSLDTNKIAEAYQSVETVYYNKFKRTTPGLDVCLLIDESGSMYGQKIEAARTCAILLNEVFSRIKHCNFYIYGHTADTKGHNVVINVYKDSWNKNKYALGEVEADSNNDDSKAIEEVYKMVRKQTSKPLLMFVISDGAPACYRISGDSGTREVKKIVDKIESTKNAIVCQIAIESCCAPETMFNHYVTMTDMSSFPRDLSNYVINTLVSKLKRVDE